MTTNPRLRKAGRFLWHYAEMSIAMALGMLLLGLLWDAVLPPGTRFDVDTMIMAADMTIGMGFWMRVRGHNWARTAEMSLAMVVPFVVLLVPYWFGAVSEHVVMSAGHALMFVAMALVMLWRHEEYTHRHHRLPIRPKWIWRSVAVVVALLPAGVVSAVNTVDKFGDRYEARQDHVTVGPRTVAHDPEKPTVAFLVGSAGANVADLLGPYEVMAGTGRMNTYVVSPGARLVPLTGGLDIVPDLTFDELPRVLGTDSVDAVVIPALREPERAELDSITGWLRQQSAAGALTVSVCNGARTLAASGLLDGRPATSHWLRLSGLRSDYSAVKWLSGQRYVDDGNVISTAGVLSGIDGALRILERLVDADTARAAAAAVHWRHYVPGASARIPEAGLEWSDLAITLNSSYQTGPGTIGVRIFDGTGELELASAFISYTEQSVVGRTVAVGEGVIHSKHGLTFVPRTSATDDLDRVVVPGVAAARQNLAGPGAEYLHTTDEFAFDPVLRDIARVYDVPTARFAAKTLEYPVVDVELTGSSWPWAETGVALLLVALGAGFVIVVSRWWSKRRGERGADLPLSRSPDDQQVRAADSVPQLRVPTP